MPAVLTCIVGKRLCASPLEDHWSLRRQASQLLATLLHRFGAKYQDLQPRVTQTLLEALHDKRKPLSTHYGALLGLTVLGHQIVHALLMPSLPEYLDALRPLLETAPMPPSAPASAPPAASARGSVAARAAKQLEALRLHGAALHTSGAYFHQHGMLAAPPPPPPPPPAPHTAATAAAIAIAAANLTGGTIAPPPRSRKGGGGATAGGTGAAGGAGAEAETGPRGAAAVGPQGRGAASLLPQVATSYGKLHDEFGQALASYTWPNDWLRADAPGLLQALL